MEYRWKLHKKSIEKLCVKNFQHLSKTVINRVRFLLHIIFTNDIVIVGLNDKVSVMNI